MDKLEKVKQAARLCTECNGVACRKCPYDEHNNGGIGVPMCGVVFATDVLSVIEQLQQRPDIVRCKDCKRATDYTDEMTDCPYHCRKYGGFHNGDWFCKGGERKGVAAREE